jgi:hypothetical protein
MTTEEIRIRVAPGKLLIRHGTCPAGCSLVDPQIKLGGYPAITALVRLHGQTGHIHLNPFYGVFEHECDLPLRAGDVVDVYCPHCGGSLSVIEQCGLCHVNMFAIQLPDGGEVRVCPKVGCHNHHLTIVDLDAQFSQLYDEERRPKM